MIEDKTFEKMVKERYAGWNSELGKNIEAKKIGFEELEQYILDNGEPRIESGKQELFENLLNEYI